MQLKEDLRTKTALYHHNSKSSDRFRRKNIYVHRDPYPSTGKSLLGLSSLISVRFIMPCLMILSHLQSLEYLFQIAS